LHAGGTSEAPRVLSTHQDVVSPGAPESWSHDPWGGERGDGRIWGRGSADMKGSIGAALFALRALKTSGLRPASDVELQCVVGEENGGLGTLSALETEPRPAAALVLEPTVLVPLAACSGCVHFTVTVDGRAAHGATPWVGVSALDKLILVYTALKELAERRRGEQDHALFSEVPDAAPLSMGVARAGEWRSSVPDRATMIGRFGVMPDEPIAHGREQIAAAVREAAARDEWLAAHPPHVSWDNAGFPGWETAAEAPIVQTLAGALESVTGQAALGAATYGSDAGHFASNGIPVVLFGPGRIGDAHSPNESVTEEEILTCAKTLALAIARHGSATDAQRR
jgi:acetylornithine deacetylase